VPTAPRFLGPTDKKFWIRLCSSGGGGPNDFLAGGSKFEVTPLRTDHTYSTSQNHNQLVYKTLK